MKYINTRAVLTAVFLSMVIVQPICAWNPFKLDDNIRIKLGEQLSAGNLKEEHEVFIQAVAKKLNITQTIPCRKPKIDIMMIYSFYKFIMYNPLTKYLYVNEEWFEALSPEERTFAVASALRSIIPKTAMSKVEKKKIVLQSILFGAQLATYIGIYKYLGTYPTIFGKPMNWKWKTLGTFLTSLPLEFVTKKLLQNYLMNLEIKASLQDDVKIIECLNCFDGALSLLKKLYGQVGALVKNDPLLNDWYDTLKIRITNLEQQKIMNAISS